MTSAEDSQIKVQFRNRNRTYDEVVTTYIDFLQSISGKVMDEKNNSQMHQRKFSAVKKELYDFFKKHSEFFEPLGCSIFLKDESIVHYTDIDTSKSCEEFIKLDNVGQSAVKIVELDSLNKEFYQKFHWALNRTEMFKRAKSVLKKDVKELKPFLQNHFLVDDIRTKCSNYKEMQIHINRRIDSYDRNEVSLERIDELSFKFEGSIENFEDQLSCGICFNEFEKNQEICHLPCNHFFCRKCTEKWFKIPEDGSYANFQCPFCRDDCI